MKGKATKEFQKILMKFGTSEGGGGKEREGGEGRERGGDEEGREGRGAGREGE